MRSIRCPTEISVGRVKPREARAAAREQLGRYAQIPFYAAMFADAGFPAASTEGMSDKLIDTLVIHGDEARIAEGLARVLAEGAGEVIAHPIVTGNERDSALERITRVVAGADA